jgi:hypothetical protein
MFEKLKQACAARALVAKDHGNGHFQIVGGPKIVNWYPFSSRGPTVYINGAKSSTKERDMNKVIDMVFV